MADRFPAIDPYACGLLDVGDGHTVYWETVGNPDGRPVLYVHGGPGAGAQPGERRLFDPARFRVVLFDQRGCGRSRPLADTAAADLTANTTAHLIADMERLRQVLGVDRWLVCGGSWGTTLALAYAQRHAERVDGLVLFAVTAGTRREVEWITRDMRRVFPAEWDELAQLVPDGSDVLAGYVRLLADPDPKVTARAAAAWCAWEDVHTSLTPGWQPWLSRQDPRFQQVFARLVTHYWANGCFLDDAPILARTDAIAHIPGVLIQGRRDVSGPLDTAWDLHRRWPASRLVVLDDAGHGGDPMRQAIIDALGADSA